LIFLPLAVHGTLKYRAANVSWRGIRFGYDGKLGELYWLYISGFFLSLITLGIYSSWMRVNVMQYFFKNLRFGQIEAGFIGEGSRLFFITIQFYISIILFFIVCIIPLGIFISIDSDNFNSNSPILHAYILAMYITMFLFIFPWYIRNRLIFLINNANLISGDKYFALNITLTNNQVRNISVLWPVTRLFTLGFSTPWVWCIQQRVFFENLFLLDDFPTESLLQVNPEYTSAVGEDLGNVLDIDFGL
jgi:uncharacterized membrane protein YjgN (DUF898 family)